MVTIAIAIVVAQPAPPPRYVVSHDVTPPRNDLRRAFDAVCMVESKGDPRAVNPAEQAVGIAQIRPICLRDCNRIVGRARWTLADRLDPVKCYAMFVVYVQYYAPGGGPEAWARCWNSGPKWREKIASTNGYWAKVKAALGGK